MWLQIVLCLCVSLAYATTNPAWRENSDYLYEVRGRTLTGLHEISDQYSGIEYKTILKIQPKSDGILQAKIQNAQIAQIHMPLSDGWKTHIPDSELAWNPFPLSSEPFQIHMENGAVKGISVNRGISNWEANMIKGIVSQFQLRVAEKSFSSEESSIPFKVREDTVTGNTATFYRIMRMPDDIVQREHNSHRLMTEKRDEDVYEVTKHKNYTNSVELPSYFYGFADLEDGFPATNQMGRFLSRGSFSRAILTGNLNRFTIQSTFTVSEILVNPTLTDKEKGSVYSIVNATLISVGTQNEGIEDVRDALYLDNLVYSYGKPFDSSNEVRQRNPSQSLDKHKLAKYHTATNLIARLRRSLEERDFLPGSEESYKQENPKLHEAPESPLLRFTVGNKGQSVKHKIDIVQKVTELAKEISEGIQDYSRSLEKQSLNKFTLLTSLVRVMDSNEMKTSGEELYKNARNENEQDAWKIYRDSVAESGTGPALLTIQEWIQSGKIEGIEASLVLGTMSRAVRQPSVQYMKTYFELIKNSKIRSNWPVNDTTILGFSNLVHEVYVDKKHSAERFPVKSFRNFRDDEGMELMNETIIPYLAEQLHRAISQAETHKIHLYIRALGNIADPQILTAFETYLEGDKQASQFQRLLMVLAMDRLAAKFPEHARSALVRLYHNNGETEEVRVAAVYQIMRTKPSSELLQYMASYTNVDKQEHVVAAVKSSIEQLSQLQGHEFLQLRQAAEVAKPLLTKKIYGVQFGGNYLHQHVIEELNYKYKDVLQIIGSEDEYYPKGIKFSLHSGKAGLRSKLMNVQAMVSSVKVLTHVLKEHMSSHSQKRQQQSLKYSQQMQYQYSSQKIAEMLGLQKDEQEQLEGSFYFESKALQALLSFDNQTIHNIVKELSKFESVLQGGMPLHFLKMSNDKEMAIAFPTEMGLPFLYTFDTPEMMRIQGRVKASASPKISQEKLQQPEHVQLESDLTMTWTSKVQGRISFITPHDHQQYVSEYSKIAHMHIPINGKIDLDIKKMEVKAEFERGSIQKPTVLFHHGTIPLVSRLDILKFEVPGSNPSTRIIEQHTRKAFEKEFGRKETGLVVRVKIDHEKPFVDLPKVKDLLSKDGFTAALVGLTNVVAMQKSDIIVTSIPQESTSQKCVVSLTYRGDRKDSESVLDDRLDQQSKNQLDLWQSASPQQRQNDILQKITRGIKNSKAEAIDVSVEFQGAEKIKYTMVGAYARSPVDPVSRVRVLYRQQFDRHTEEPYVVAMDVENVVVNANEPNLEYSMQNKPEIKSEIQIAFGSNPDRSSIVHTKLAFTRSHEREQYLRDQPMYKQCRSEMREGNNQLQACANATMASNLLDRIDAKVLYRNIPSKMETIMRDLFYAVKYRYYPSIVYAYQQGLASENELSLQAKFDPDLRSVNVSIATENQQVKLESIVLNQWVRPAVVLHPVIDVRERVMAKVFGVHTYRPLCVIDKTKISTFNNQTFPADISDKWTVMFQYLPKLPRHAESSGLLTEQLRHQTENFVVLVRAAPSGNGKDLKITINSPETKFEVVDITMTPRQQQGEKVARAKVTVNEKEVQVDENKSYDYEHGYIQIYTLPGGGVTVEIKDQFFVLYDGERVKLSVSDGKFKDATRGICGQFTEERVEDFVTPQNCYVQDHHWFIRSFEVEGSEGQTVRHQLKSGNEKECVRKVSPLYVDVISSNNKQTWQKQSLQQCTAFQTQYVQDNDDVCFTLRPLPKCVRGCQSTDSVEKDVPVHCVQKSNIVQHWKNQIDNGINPDFSRQTESKTVKIQIPQSCV